MTSRRRKMINLTDNEIGKAHEVIDRHPLLDFANVYEKLDAVVTLKVASLQHGKLGKDMGLWDLAHRYIELERRVG
jgi:hypothetical protein